MIDTKSKPNHTLEDATHFIAQLNHEAKNHRAIHHPFLQRLSNGEFPDTKLALKDFAYQYLAYSQDFTRFLTVTISKLELRKDRQSLIENLVEESGHVDQDDEKALKEIGVDIDWIQGVPHPVLFTRFLDAIGYDSEYRKQHDFCDEAKIWSHMFLNVCTAGGAAQSLGAMGLGTENIVKYIYRPILESIDKFLDVSPKQRVFFDLHALLDDEHGEVLDNIAIGYAMYERHREPLRDGMLMALNLRAGFFDAMLARAESQCSTISRVANG